MMGDIAVSPYGKVVLIFPRAENLAISMIEAMLVLY